MLFNSSQFLLVFLPVVLLVYYRLNHSAQNAFLVLASCVFYAAWDWRFLLPLLCTTTTDYFVARRMEASHARKESPTHRKPWLYLSLLVNLGLLAFFKYWNFLIQSIAQVLGLLSLPVPQSRWHIILPVAISFYTFQALSYTIDVYRGKLHATRSFWDFFLAVLYFPHLVAGPIQRASSLLPQVSNPRVIQREQVLTGLHLMLWGYFKKVFIADNLAPIVDAIFGGGHPTGGAVLTGVLAFAMQIYCDFSGYTDIARGIANLMGFEFQLNFNLPYIARNPSDFWRRWHISLSSWLRDYLYISLGGNRGTEPKIYRNLMVTMLLGGLWHGAAWNFVLWGIYHGAIQCAHRWYVSVTRTFRATIAFGHRLSATVSIVLMFAATCYGWLLFRARSMAQIGEMTLALRHPLGGMDVSLLYKVLAYSSPVIVMQIFQARAGDLLVLRRETTPDFVKVTMYSLMLYGCLFAGGVAQEFVYFRF